MNALEREYEKILKKGELHLVYGPNPGGTESETSDVYQILDKDWMDKGALSRLPVDENKITNLIKVFNILDHSYEKSRANESAELKVYLHEILRVSREEYKCYSAYLGSLSMKGPFRTIYFNGTLELGETLTEEGAERIEDWVAMCRAQLRKKGELSKEDVEKLAGHR